MNSLSLITKRLQNLIRRVIFHWRKISYAQCGEDLIIDFVFGALGIHKPSYLDIGAYDAERFSNTALFYKKGGTGICVEPDPHLFKKLNKKRPRDLCLNVGIGPKSAPDADFYILSEPTLNTFSKTEAERYVSYGSKKIKEVIKVPILSINDLLGTYCPSTPDFISLDIEGLDLELLKSVDFERFRPVIWCIETITYTENNSEQKIGEIINLLLSKGYFVYADTYINTIFVDKKTWDQRS